MEDVRKAALDAYAFVCELRSHITSEIVPRHLGIAEGYGSIQF